MKRKLNELTMSIHGNQRHSYFIGVLSKLIHQLQHKTLGDDTWDELYSSKLKIVRH
jgi:hypothetical protein